jgi:hypothetical protein
MREDEIIDALEGASMVLFGAYCVKVGLFGIGLIVFILLFREASRRKL